MAGFAVQQAISANPQSVQRPLRDRLAQPLSLSLQGVAIRDAASRICTEKKINLWFDTRCNPSTPVHLDATSQPESGTTWASLTNLADQANLVILPVDNILVFTQVEYAGEFAAWPGWTAGPSERVASGPVASRTRCDVQWPLLTPPTTAVEAINRAAGRNTPGTDSAQEPLTHDLLALTRWVAIDPNVGVQLIRIGNQRGEIAKPVGISQSDAGPGKADPGPRYKWPYAKGRLRLPEGSQPVRPERGLRNADRFRWIRADAAQHKRLLDQWIGQAATNAKTRASKVNLTTKFSLRVRAPAESLLRKLATTAGRTLEIELADASRAKKVIDFEATDETLAALLERAATAIDATVRITPTQVIVGDSVPVPK